MYSLDGKTLAGFAYEVFDLEYFATKERRAKTRRLMLTPDFSEWKTRAFIRGPGNAISSESVPGSQPNFATTAKKYNAQGGEKVEKPVMTADGK